MIQVVMSAAVGALGAARPMLRRPITRILPSRESLRKCRDGSPIVLTRIGDVPPSVILADPALF